MKLLLSAIFLFLGSAGAHRPLLTSNSCGDDFSSSTTAVNVPDPAISWAFRHYADCTSRMLWASWINPSSNFSFYVGVGVPTLPRFADVRANALVIGPGLPTLDDNSVVWNALPEVVRSDPVWQTPNVGAYYHTSPADQSTCAHLGTVMTEASTVRNGRCDFYEPFSRTHSWRVLDADNNLLPLEGERYYVVVYPQDDVSAKLSVALGTWVENFRTPFVLDEPNCTRDLTDFYEKETSTPSDCFPLVSCPANNGPVGDCIATQAANNDTAAAVCELGGTCQDAQGCEIANVTYMAPMHGGCGGQRCPAAVQTWDVVNGRMHTGMMDLEYTGNAAIDFARSMIPHHVGAVEMCEALLQDLTCTKVEDGIDELEGLVHFCSHVEYEQELEVGGLQRWLLARNLSETAPCPEVAAKSTETVENGLHGGTMDLPESCGAVEVPSSAKFIALNHKMHEYMAVNYTCDHTTDFVRMMLPHHAGAIDMCNILMESLGENDGPDDYLVELCGNITRTQKAEIAWMYEWLMARNMSTSMPCNCPMDSYDHDNGGMTNHTNTGMMPDMLDQQDRPEPCEDLLSTSSFCHGLGFGQDGYCKCQDTLDLLGPDVSCDREASFVDGIGLFVPAQVCRRSCGMCPFASTEDSYWFGGCSSKTDHSGHESHGDSSMGGDMSAASVCGVWTVTTVVLTVLLALLV